ncbi:MAG: leucine-rich repeat domain-containing protein [Opitutae bacterium]|nr:leucine-rich repeat domain-containing protein [Opitutae bacterium]
MNVLCVVGLHAWNNCKCKRCRKERDREHNWIGCKCGTCGKVRDEQHAWQGCVCASCDKQRDQDHSWVGCKCGTCGKVRDEQHVWQGCVCASCGKQRDQDHFWAGCKCTACGKTRDSEHSWDGSFCPVCGMYAVTSGLTRIDQSTFGKPKAISNISIPASVTNIDLVALAGCKNLLAVTVDKTNGHYCSLDGVLFDKTETRLLFFPRGRKGGYTPPEGVRAIEERAFAGCDGLTDVFIKTSTTTIGQEAFKGCTGLPHLTIPSTMERIGDRAFMGCSSLYDVMIREGQHAFARGRDIFAGCGSLTHVTLSRRNAGGNERIDLASW